MANPEQIVDLSQNVSRVTQKKIEAINKITKATKILALNALIEAARAGETGRGFAVVANEVKRISSQITDIAQELQTELASSITELNDLGKVLVHSIRGTRLADLSLNMVDIIDRNLYERSCDVRWWATDSAVVESLQHPSPEKWAFASDRLSVILNSYTVYLDLWVVDKNGTVVASGRPAQYPATKGHNVAGQAWFQDAMKTSSGDDYTAHDVSVNAALNNAQVATYATAIRENGGAHERPLGAIGIFFDWEPQARAVTQGVRLLDSERGSTRCMILDSSHRVIASSDGVGTLTETFPLVTKGEKVGHYQSDSGDMIGFALTPGYETYLGLGWYGVVVQKSFH